jgi:hypothetical protein
MKLFSTAPLGPSSFSHSTIRVSGLAPFIRPMLLVLAVALGNSGTAWAQQGPPAWVSQTDSESLRVRIDNPAALACQVRVIQLSSGESLFYEASQTPAYGHRFNFRQVPTGRYALVLRVGPNRYRYTIEVQTQKQRPTTIAVREVNTHQVENALANTAL